MSRFKNYIKSTDVSCRINFAIMALLFIFCSGSAIYFFTLPRIRDGFNSLAYLLVVPLYYFLQRILKIKIPCLFTAVTAVFTAACLLGSSYNLYTTIPYLDDILHGVWGVVFSIIGFTVIKCFIGEPRYLKQFVLCAVFAISFTALTAVIWEIYEYTADLLFVGLDMQEDTVVNTIHSFLLYPEYDHYHTEVIEGIAYTVLYDADGNALFTIEGGYLDIGINDTMRDIIWCFAASVATCLILTIERRFGKKFIYRLLITEQRD